MKNHLLPFLFIALFFSSCTPDEDVDMPVPENTLAEKIQGDWYNYEASTKWYWDEDQTRPVDDWVYTQPSYKLDRYYRFDEHTVYFGVVNPYAENDYQGPDIPDYFPPTYFGGMDKSPYYLIKQNNTTYIHYNSSLEPQLSEAYEELNSGDWEIESITDSTMTWRQKFHNHIEREAGSDSTIPVTIYYLKFRKTTIAE